MTSLSILHSLPDGLRDTAARDLHRVLNGPTLIELPGKRGRPLFVSALLHGNEDSGLGAIQRVLRKFADLALPRPLMLFIGNVAAAREGMRRLENQPDFNRVWPGLDGDSCSDEAAIMAQVHNRVVERQAFAAIDIHNNTGRNPHYGVVCVRDERVMGLAALFAPRAVLFRGLPGTQTASFSGLLPAITVECGQPGSDANAEAAARFVEAALALEELPGIGAGSNALTLFHTLARVRVKPEIALEGQRNGPWLRLEQGLDELNFLPVNAGARFGTTNHAMPLEAIDEQGRDVADAFFGIEDGVVHLKASAIPAMLTQDPQIVRQDCLCYLMEALQ